MAETYTPAQTAAARAAWAAALRSGEYPQTIGSLERVVPDERGRPVGFCCLGVACAVLAPELRRVNRSDSDVAYYGSQHAFLPERVARLLDISNDGHLVERVHGYDSLTGLNDRVGMTFDQIADVIEDGLLLDESTARTPVLLYD